MKHFCVNDIAVTDEFNMVPGDLFSPTQDVIAALAHEFWKRRGSPLGSPEEDWFQAERQTEHHRTPGSAV